MITAAYINQTPDRLSFLPDRLPREFMKFENLVYSLARYYCAEYDGGYWEYVVGRDMPEAWFMYPKMYGQHTSGLLQVENPDNFSGNLLITPIEFGVGVTLIALSSLSFHTSFEAQERISNHHRALYELVRKHGSATLCSLID